jgi:hypothetical protein
MSETKAPNPESELTSGNRSAKEDDVIELDREYVLGVCERKSTRPLPHAVSPS